MNFKVGEKIVCVDDSKPLNGGSMRLTKGAIYTLKSIEHDGLWYLVEPNTYGPWMPSRFRKLSDVSSELSEEILEKIKVTEEETITV